jgi:hypothetical protein
MRTSPIPRASVRVAITGAALIASSTLVALSACSSGGESESSDPCYIQCDFWLTCEDYFDEGYTVQDCVDDGCSIPVEWELDCGEELQTAELCYMDKMADLGCDHDSAMDACAVQYQAYDDCLCTPECTSLLLGDGACDDECNVEECDFDDGDCV